MISTIANVTGNRIEWFEPGRAVLISDLRPFWVLQPSSCNWAEIATFGLIHVPVLAGRQKHSEGRMDTLPEPARRKVDSEFDIFEQFSDGSVVWWDAVHGLEAARARVEQLAVRSSNEFVAVDTITQDIAVRVNMPGTMRG
jgi:hypothetical protein